MKKFLAIVLLSTVFLFVGCSSNRIDQRLIALEQSVNDTNIKIEKINLTLSAIKKEQADIRMITEENEKRISMLETAGGSKHALGKQEEGSVTFVKGSTAFISLGKNDGVKLGDVFDVYKTRESKEKIASLKITAVDLGASSGEIEGKAQDIGVGYFVKIAK